MSYFCSLRPLDSVARNGLYFSNQIFFLKCGGHSLPNPPAGPLPPAIPPVLRPWTPPPPVNPFHHISYHIYQYYCYNMFLSHRVVIGHSKYFFRMYFAKNIVCAMEVGHFGTRPMYSVLGPKDLSYLLGTQYTISNFMLAFFENHLFLI